MSAATIKDEEIGKLFDPTVCADTIRRLRRSAGYTQASFAELLGVSTMTVVRWESGNMASSVNLAKAFEICYLFRIPMETLVTGLPKNWRAYQRIHEADGPVGVLR